MSDSPSLRTPNTTAQEGEALGETMSEPFAAIPLSWGAKPCPYHTFLIWLACLMSGQDGFKGLKAGQVKFSRRDAEIALGQSHSLVTSHTRRAIRDGYLKTDWDIKLDTAAMLDECNRVLRPNGALVLFAQDPYTSELITNAHGNLPFSYRYPRY